LENIHLHQLFIAIWLRVKMTQTQWSAWTNSEELCAWGKWVSLTFFTCCTLLYSFTFIIHKADAWPLDKVWFFSVAKIMFVNWKIRINLHRLL